MLEADDKGLLYNLCLFFRVSSEAMRVAQFAGIPPEVLERASSVLKSVAKASPIPVDLNMYPAEELLEIGDSFLEINLDSEEFEPKMAELISRLAGISTIESS